MVESFLNYDYEIDPQETDPQDNRDKQSVVEKHFPLLMRCFKTHNPDKGVLSSFRQG